MTSSILISCTPTSRFPRMSSYECLHSSYTSARLQNVKPPSPPPEGQTYKSGSITLISRTTFGCCKSQAQIHPNQQQNSTYICFRLTCYSTSPSLLQMQRRKKHNHEVKQIIQQLWGCFTLLSKLISLSTWTACCDFNRKRLNLASDKCSKWCWS